MRHADTRSVKPFSKRAYDHGVVIVKCPVCQSHHLLSDQLGWYGAKQNIEDILSEKGESKLILLDLLWMKHLHILECAAGGEN